MGMNLHASVRGIISAVNSPVPAALFLSTGRQQNADFTLTPTYAPPLLASAQVQSLTFRDIMQVDGLNLQGTRRAIYLNGKIDGLVRPTGQGGDIVLIRQGAHRGAWLVAIVLEQWSDWVKVAVTLQNGKGWEPPYGEVWQPP